MSTKQKHIDHYQIQKIKELFSESTSSMFIQLILDVENLISKVKMLSNDKHQDTGFCCKNLR
jgi:hypothetical protein